MRNKFDIDALNKSIDAIDNAWKKAATEDNIYYVWSEKAKQVILEILPDANVNVMPKRFMGVQDEDGTIYVFKKEEVFPHYSITFDSADGDWKEGKQ